MDLSPPTEPAALSGQFIPRYPELAGRVAIVTGSTRKIGLGIALRLAREGMKVVITSRDRRAVEETARAIGAQGADVLGVPADMESTRDVDGLFRDTLERFGTVDLLVNNAADTKRVPFFDVSEEMLDHQLGTNVKGPYLCAMRAAEAMRKKREGSIVNISSVGGIRAHWTGLPYDVTKGALDAMTRAMALELAEYGIRVNAVAPGAIRTEALPEDAALREVIRRIPLGRFGLPHEIGAAVAFLASSEAMYITGTVVYVDGGITAQLSPKGQQI